jgi:hypothetical protein
MKEIIKVYIPIKWESLIKGYWKDSLRLFICLIKYTVCLPVLNVYQIIP